MLLLDGLFVSLQSIILPAILVAHSGAAVRPHQSIQRVDLIELNHCHDETGRHCYDQLVFYEWSPDYRRYHVVAWCLVDQGLARMPAFDHSKRLYIVSWYDRESGRHREIWSPIFRETWSDSDPERANKKLLDEKYRVTLLRQPARRDMR
jgi:hypothetical protein